MNALAFSPDGKVLASANMDNMAKLWQVPNGKWKADLASHTLSVFDVAFSPDGRTVATLGRDALKLWNVETGQELMTFPGTIADSGVFSPDGRSLAVGSGKLVRIWHAPTLAEIEKKEQARAKAELGSGEISSHESTRN
jgi:WD40 repeat protein